MQRDPSWDEVLAALVGWAIRTGVYAVVAYFVLRLAIQG